MWFQNTGTFTNNSNSLSNSFVAMPATAQPSGNNNQDLVYNTIMVSFSLKWNNDLHINLGCDSVINCVFMNVFNLCIGNT